MASGSRFACHSGMGRVKEGEKAKVPWVAGEGLSETTWWESVSRVCYINISRCFIEQTKTSPYLRHFECFIFPETSYILANLRILSPKLATPLAFVYFRKRFSLQNCRVSGLKASTRSGNRGRQDMFRNEWMSLGAKADGCSWLTLCHQIPYLVPLGLPSLASYLEHLHPSP